MPVVYSALKRFDPAFVKRGGGSQAGRSSVRRRRAGDAGAEKEVEVALPRDSQSEGVGGAKPSDRIGTSRRKVMKTAKLDELDCLRSNADLLALLSHYALLAEAELEAWHDRLKHLDGVEPPQMARLHGELIAFAWIEQNTGVVPACYRITLDGWRAIKQAQWQGREEESPTIAPPKFLRKKRKKNEAAAPMLSTSESITSQ